jgi:hypothetical protein
MGGGDFHRLQYCGKFVSTYDVLIQVMMDYREADTSLRELASLVNQPVIIANDDAVAVHLYVLSRRNDIDKGSYYALFSGNGDYTPSMVEDLRSLVGCKNLSGFIGLLLPCKGK